MKLTKRVPRKGSIRFQTWKQIILAILLITAVTFLYDGYKRTRRAALENYSEQQRIYADQIINGVRFRFDLIRNVLELWSTTSEIRHMSEETQGSMERLLEAHGSYISSITRMDENGIIRYTVPLYAGTVGADISYQAHIQKLLEPQTAVMSDAFLTVQGYWAIAYHVPCFDKEGGFRGSLAFLVPFREMFRELFTQLLPEKDIVPLVLDSQGQVLYSPLEEHEGRHYTDALAGLEGLLGLISGADSLAGGFSVIESRRGFDESLPRANMLCTVVPFDFQGTEWTMILSVPESTIMRNIADLSNRWLIGMAAIILLAMIYSTLKLRVWITSSEEKKWQDVARLKDILIRTVDQAREVILILDDKERIVYSNRTSTSVTGYGGNYLGRRVSRVPFLELEPSIAEIRKKVMLKGSWSGRVMGVALENHPFRLDITASAVTDDDGGITNFIIIGRDVTEQMEMERRLLEQQKMEAIGQLAGGIAHDFNNLLVGVLGYAELLKEHHSPDSDVSRAADVIIAAVHQASELTRQLLGYARKGKHQVARIDVAECVRKVNKLLMRTLDRRIAVNLQLEEGIFVKGDESQIEQVALNLAVNARDAMPEGGELRFSLEKQTLAPGITGQPSEEEPQELAVLKTSDTGSGIPEEYLERIFEPFFTTKAEEGTGMGLATVYGIVINHGGWIDVDSQPGRGSVFTVYLPVDRGGEVDGQEETKPPSNAGRGSGRAVMVVDDEFVVVNTLMELLKELGYTVVAASGGEAALRLFSDEPQAFDAIILDLSMPEMDGKECFLRLREIDPGVKVILATGFSRDGRVQELLNIGVRGFLQKPFRLKELAEMLESVLES
ncbi:MAG: response regulator [Candidatus Fermentibacteraceae bacterium]|nr:response regulator [Candidatus Fermentibacteraceae bacterium]